MSINLVSKFSQIQQNVLRFVPSEIFQQFHKQHGAQAFGVPFESLKALVFSSRLRRMTSGGGRKGDEK